MKNDPPPVLPFPCGAGCTHRSALQKNLLEALRFSESHAIVDLSGCRTLDREDIDLLLDCIGRAVGRDTQLVFVAGSPDVRMILDVTRISSLVPVVGSAEEARAYGRLAPESGSTENQPPNL